MSARSARARCTRSCTAARPGVRTADAAPPARGLGREPVLRARARPCSRHGRRPDAAAAGPGDARGARARAPRRVAGRDARDVAARVRARPASQPAQLDGDALEPAFADHVIELADGVIRFTHPLLASVLYQGASRRERRRAHATPRRDRRRPARARTSPCARLGASRTREIAAALEEAADARERPGAPIVGGRAGRARAPPDAARLRARIGTAARSRPRARTWRREMRAARGARRSSSSSAPAGPARAEALVLLERPRGRRRDSIALARRGAARGGRGSRSAGGDPPAARLAAGFTEGPRVGGAACARPLELAEELDDDALRAGALSVLASVRFHARRCRTRSQLAESAPTSSRSARRPRQLKEASSVAGSRARLVASSSGRARCSRASTREWSERDERSRPTCSGIWPWSSSRPAGWRSRPTHAERAREITAAVRDRRPRVPRSSGPSRSIAAHRGELERARELADRAAQLAEAGPPIVSGLDGGARARRAVERRPGGRRRAVRGRRRGRADAGGLARAGTCAGGAPTTSRRCSRSAGSTRRLRVLDAWEADAARLGRAWVLAHATRCRGLVAAARGDVEEAAVDCSSRRSRSTRRSAIRSAARGRCSRSASSGGARGRSARPARRSRRRSPASRSSGRPAGRRRRAPSSGGSAGAPGSRG